MNTSALVLFRSVGRAIVEKGLTELALGQGFGPKLQDVNNKVYEHFHKGCKGLRYLDVVVAVAGTEAFEAKEISGTVVRELREDPSHGNRLESQEVRERLLAYLEQVPVTVRNRFRRPSDPTGRTIPPDFRIARPEDLLVLLPAKAPRFRAGECPVGDWELTQLLGIGAFGEVWKAVDPKNRDQGGVALKFCLTPESVRYLKHETGLLQRIVKQVGEKNGIVRLRQAWLDADPPCLEYEFVNGGDLCGLMSEWLNLKPEKRVKLALQMLQRLSKTVAALHEMSPPIVHRDLKPANVLIARGNSGKFDLKISDFGIGGLAAGKALENHSSGVSQAEILTQTLRGSHTPIYAGPEQQGGAPPHPSDDVHALGVIGFQLLVCDLRRGPSGDWDEELRERAVPQAAIAVLRRCLARQTRRFQNAGELQAGLDMVLQGGTFATETEPVYPLQRSIETVRATLPVDPASDRPETIHGWNAGMHAPQSARVEKLETGFHPELASPTLSIPPLPDGSKNNSAIIREKKIYFTDPISNFIKKLRKNKKTITRVNRIGIVLILVVSLAVGGWILSQFFQTNPNMDTYSKRPFKPETFPLTKGLEQREKGFDMEVGMAPGKIPQSLDQNVFPLTGDQAKALQAEWSGRNSLPVESLVPLGNGKPIRLILVPPGKFLMGSPENEIERRDAERQHWVTITQPFYISKFEVSQDEWKAVMGKNPSLYSSTGAASDKVPLNTGNYPVDQVSFNEALEFCQKLPELNGWKAMLPTEAEWEYACRAGSATVFPWGNSLNGDRANCDGRYPYGITDPGPDIGRPVEVGCYASNPWGIYDMIGNVREWCLDSFREFDGNAATDPVYINHNGKRISRGGAWGDLARNCRTSHRVDFDAFLSNPGVGVRVIYKKLDLSLNYREPVQASSGTNQKEISRVESGANASNTSAFGGVNTLQGKNITYIDNIPCGSAVYSVSVSKDGKLLATGSADSNIKLWDPETGKALYQLLGHKAPVLSVAISPNRKLIASGSSDQSASIWNYETKNKVMDLKSHKGSVLSVGFSVDGGYLVTGGGDSKVIIWNLENGAVVRELSGHKGSVLKAVFSPNGKLIASAGEDNSIIIWNVSTGEQVMKLSGHTGWIYGLSFSPDGKWLASGSNDKKIKLWDMSTGKENGEMIGHKGVVFSVDFSQDSQFLCSGSSDRTARVWNPFTGQQILDMQRHQNRVDCVTFSPNGEYLISASADSSVKITKIKGNNNGSQSMAPNQNAREGIEKNKARGENKVGKSNPANTKPVVLSTNKMALFLDSGNPLSYPGRGPLWRDISGNNNHFVINPRAYKQDRNVKFMDFRGMNGIAIKMDNGEVPFFKETDIFVVTRILEKNDDWRTMFRAKNLQFGDHHAVINKGTDDFGFYEGSKNRFYSFETPTKLDVSKTSDNYSKFQLFNFQYLRNNNNESTLRLNCSSGQFSIEKSSEIRFDQGINAIGGVQIGPSQFWGDIAVVIVYKELVAEAERDLIMQYLRDRF